MTSHAASDEPVLVRPRRMIRILANVAMLGGLLLLALDLAVWTHFTLTKQLLPTGDTYRWDNSVVFLQKTDTATLFAHCGVRADGAPPTQVNVPTFISGLIDGNVLDSDLRGNLATITCDAPVNISSGFLVHLYNRTDRSDLYTGVLLVALGGFAFWRLRRIGIQEPRRRR